MDGGIYKNEQMLDVLIKLTLGLMCASSLLYIPRIGNKFTSIIIKYRLTLKNQLIYFVTYCIFALVISLLLDSIWSLNKVAKIRPDGLKIAENEQNALITNGSKVAQQYQKRVNNFKQSCLVFVFWSVFYAIILHFSKIANKLNPQNGNTNATFNQKTSQIMQPKMQEKSQIKQRQQKDFKKQNNSNSQKKQKNQKINQKKNS